MADPQILTTLRRKRDEIENTIAAYEKAIEKARYDLAHINATMRLFDVNDPDPTRGARYVDTHRLFKRGEIMSIVKDALAKEGPLDTRELAVRAIRARGLDEADKVLRNSITYRIVQAMRMQEKRGKVARVERRGTVIVWRLREI